MTTNPNEKIQFEPFTMSSPIDHSFNKGAKIGQLYNSSSNSSNSPVDHPTQRQKWYQYFSPTDTPEEKRLILKLDALIMVFLFFAHWAKVLDSSATSTAYVSGMKEDLRMFGNELNYLNTVYM